MIGDDALVFAFVLIVLAVWGFVAFRRWLYKPPEVKVPEAADGAKPKGEAVEVLNEHGYDVTFGKWKVDVTVHVDDKELGSSLFVDYVAKRDGRTFVVKLAKSRKPLDLTVGSAVREQLLTYALLYEDTAGVLYVDVANRKVHQIRFELEL